MNKFNIKLHNCLIKYLGQDIINLSSYQLVDEREMNYFNVVFSYPGQECIKYFEHLGFRVFEYDKLPLDHLIFTNNEFLDYLLDDGQEVYPDKIYPIAKVIYFV